MRCFPHVMFPILQLEDNGALVYNIKFCLPVALYTSVFDVLTINYAIEEVSLKSPCLT